MTRKRYPDVLWAVVMTQRADKMLWSQYRSRAEAEASRKAAVKQYGFPGRRFSVRRYEVVA